MSDKLHMVKIWTLPLRYTEDKVWEHTERPLEMEFEEELLQDMGFGETPVIEMTLIPKRMIFLLFQSKEAAEVYLLGFQFGGTIHAKGEEAWQYRLDNYIEQEVSKNKPVTDSDGLRGFKL